MAPEHRLSLQLRCQELALQGSEAGAAVVEQLSALARLPYMDVMDESDELLHHRWATCRSSPSYSLYILIVSGNVVMRQQGAALMLSA